ncbi:S9 family peptidase [Fodinibius saliphilus]|uniref:S9 family peptidase n=1 Tax=Fodinibius saliphilus TaxID=1920650 RepID=UPI0011094F13|nr:prolyl oligopeptidase family serine peptidase [Fodinibius saliphilus]
MKTLRQLFFFVISVLIYIPAVNGQTFNWTVADVINQERASSLQFSPDGNLLVWIKSKPNKEKDRSESDLYLTRFDVKEDGKYKTIQLTRGKESDFSPLFSKDGETIYFLSSREKGKKLWAMSVYGGEPYEIHEFETGISDIQWLEDKKLAFKSNEGKTLYEQKLEEEEDNTIVVEDTAHFKPSRIYSFDLKKKTISRLTDNKYPVGEYTVSENGKWLISSHIMSPDYRADANPKPNYYLWNLEHETKKEILKMGFQTPGNFKFTDDNEGFYFVSVKSSDPQWNGAGISMLHYYDINEEKAQKVPIDWNWGLGSGFDVFGNDVMVGLANGATTKLAYLQKDGNEWDKKPVDAGKMNQHITITAVGHEHKKLVSVYSTASTPPQYHLSDLNIKRRKVSISEGTEVIALNEYLDKKPKAKSEVISWTGAKGDEVTGILFYPEDYEEGRQYPLIVSIHGGPSGVDTDRWSDSWAYFPNIYSQKGAFVLNPNYHGSSNHGQEFVESIKGHYYEFEIPDIIAGIDMLEEKGMIDRDSLGVKGWSNGAILTTMLTVQHPNLFKAAAPGAGDVNWTSDYGTCAFGVSFDQSYFGGAPWDNTNGKIFNETYIQKSPLFEMEKVKTPTIIFHGSKDRAVPRDQGWEYYRALQQIGKAPVRFLWFPNQPHGLRKITHQTRKMEEEIRWFDKHLFGTYEGKNEAFKKESPLAELLKKDKAQIKNGQYGVVINDILIPETVSIKEDSIAIGRFEVTNAQYAEFDKDHSFPSVRANYPVVDISPEKAQQYLGWLSKKTGDAYRLPNSSEAATLHKKAKKVAAKENTLNFWAGYNITIDEVSEFRSKLENLDHTMLKEVGTYPGVSIGEAHIYDLGGNVAEWYTAETDPQTYGYSAISFVDDRGEISSVPKQYSGFRVIKE